MENKKRTSDKHLFSGNQSIYDKGGFLNSRFKRLLALALSVCAIWLTIENRWGANFQSPSVYGRGDDIYVLGMMKLAKQGDLGLFSHIYTDSLGAPFKGQLNDFIQTERVIIWLGGNLARVVGLMPAANLMLMGSCMLAAFSYYSASRLWRVSRLTSWFFALVYAFLSHTQRSISSLGIIFTGLLPLQFYVLWYVAVAQNLYWRSSRFKLTLVVSLFTGMLNIYWIFLFLNLYVLSLLCRLVKRSKGFVKAITPLLITCVTSGLFLGSFVLYRGKYGANLLAIAREYFDTELFSLKPLDLFIPNWWKHLELTTHFFSRYYDGGRLRIGEFWWGCYIGFLAIAGLLFLCLRVVTRQVNKRSTPLPFLALLWIISYSCFGGIHSIFSLLLNFYDIRGTNRYFVAIATIGLIYLGFFINRLTRKWTVWGKVAFLSSLSFLGIADQSFMIYKRSRNKTSPSIVRQSLESDKAFALHLEGSLGKGSMVFMLPVLDFPEPNHIIMTKGFSFYLYGSLSPFLYSTNLRYSYGSHKGRLGADWQIAVAELPAKEMAAKLESYGFSGIVLNRRAYDDRGNQLLSELSEAGYPIEFEQGLDNEWVFIRLTPEAHPIFPTHTPYAVTPQEKGAVVSQSKYWVKRIGD